MWNYDDSPECGRVGFWRTCNIPYIYDELELQNPCSWKSAELYSALEL